MLQTIKSRCLSLFFPKKDKGSFNELLKYESSINLYKLLNGNIKAFNRMDKQEIDNILSFIKYYNQIIVDEKEILSMSLISKFAKFKKEVLNIYIESIKHYYNDLAKIKLDPNSSELTFISLHKEYRKLNQK